MKKLKLGAARISLFVTLGVMFISMFGYSLVQTSGYSVKENTYTVTLKELANQMRDNMTESGKTVDILFTEDTSATFSFSTYVPQNATKDTPAPAVIGAHGYNNSKEMQLSNITELTRRGYVVVVSDLAGHGRSDIEISELTGDTEGVLAAIQYAMTMDCVDNTKIGITGHSAGDLMAINAIKLINTAGATNRVSAFFCPCGTIAALFSMGQQNLILGVAAGKYDELDTFYFSSNDFLNSAIAKMMVKSVYPAFAEDSVPEGQWYTPAGPVATPAGGNSLGVSSAVAIWNPAITHVGGTFSRVATDLSVEFFYAAFGTPAGETYLAGSHQIWQLAVVFQTLGLLAFFAAAIVFAANLLLVKSFAKINAVSGGSASKGIALEADEKPVSKVVEQKDLPSIKSWKEWVPILVTFVPLILFPFLMYYPCYNAAARLFGDGYSAPNVNGIALFTLASGLFSFFMLFVNYLVRKLVHLKDGQKVESLFSYGKVGSFGQLAKTFLMSGLVVILMYATCYIAYNVFHMNFGISVYVVGLPRFEWLPDMLIRYLPFYLIFMIPNCMLNAGARFKEIPEWGSTLFIALANLLPIVVLIIINYTNLITKGQTYYTFGDPSIMIWNLLAPMIFIAITGRYFYKKTGNIWTGVFISALVLTIMALTITRHTVSGLFTF